MILSESGEEQSRKFYHQMPRKGLKYSFMGICMYLYVCRIHSPAVDLVPTGTWVTAQTLSLLFTIVSVITEVAHAYEKVDRYSVHTYIRPHV